MPMLSSRKRRATQAEPEPASEEDVSPEPATQRRRLSTDDDEAFDTNEVDGEDSNLEQMVKKMVRLALACEYQRRPIRRADVGEKVLGSAGRQFKSVFEAAQTELRHVFGMEMIELPAKEKVTLQQKRAAQKQSQASKTAASWILVSILPTEYHDPCILQPSVAPTTTEDSKYTAIYTVLVSLIRLSGDNLPDAKMDRYLRRMHMEDTTPVQAYDKTASLLKRLERDGYIVKVREAVGQDEDIYWTVGPRGKVEIGNAGVVGLTRAVYNPEDEEARAELERKLGRSLSLGENPVEDRVENADGKAKRRRGRPRSNETRADDVEEAAESSGEE